MEALACVRAGSCQERSRKIGAKPAARSMALRSLRGTSSCSAKMQHHFARRRRTATLDEAKMLLRNLCLKRKIELAQMTQFPP